MGEFWESVKQASYNLWQNLGLLTDSQAQLLSTLILVIGGGLGVWLGSVLYGKRVTDLKGAVEEAESEIAEFRDETANRLNDFRVLMQEQLAVLKEQLDQTTAQLSRARKEITALSDDDDEPPFKEAHNQVIGEQGDRAAFKEDWYIIRDLLWDIADSDALHGQRRNKYTSYTNNQLSLLIDVMYNDHELNQDQVELFHEAHDLFSWHRNGRPFLAVADVERMRELRVALSA